MAYFPFNPDDYTESPLEQTKECLLRAFSWSYVEEHEKLTAYFWANVSVALERLEVRNDKRASKQR